MMSAAAAGAVGRALHLRFQGPQLAAADGKRGRCLSRSQEPARDRHPLRTDRGADRSARRTAAEQRTRHPARGSVARSAGPLRDRGGRNAFAVLHTGARVVFSRWAHYNALAERLLADTDLKVVLFTGDPDLRAKLSPGLAGSDRLVIVDGLLPFDEFRRAAVPSARSMSAMIRGRSTSPRCAACRWSASIPRASTGANGARSTAASSSRARCRVRAARSITTWTNAGRDFVCVKAITLDDVYGAVRRYV